MDRIPLCLVGCGGMGQRHLRGLAMLERHGVSNVQLRAVCDLDVDAARRIADHAADLLGERPAVYTSIESALDDEELMAFDLVTDASSHHRVAVPVLDAGRHVICEKPLGITVRSCAAIVEAARRSGTVLATAENYRRGPANRLAKAVIDSGVLGDIHHYVEFHVGGDDGVIITPWRHQKERGAIGLDMTVHYTDIIQYLLGGFESVFGVGFIAEPIRRRRAAPEMALSSYEARHASMPEEVVATGEDAAIALFKMASGLTAQCVYVASGPDRRWARTVYGREGVMEIPRDRSGAGITVTLSDRTVNGDEVVGLVDDFELDDVTSAVFGGVTYDRPFEDVDAAHLAVELADFGRAILEGGTPEVDGELGLHAVAAVQGIFESSRLGRSVTMDELLTGAVSGYQDEIDRTLGLLEDEVEQ